MKRFLSMALLAGLALTGCAPKSTITGQTAPAALAPGYATPFDQSTGQILASAHALVKQATTDYANLSLNQQAAEKPVLNGLVTAVNLADSLYLSYRAGTATQAQVQAQLNTVSAAQTTYTNQAVK